MAHVTEQQLFLEIGRMYSIAVVEGLEQIPIHVNWLAEVLDYLDAKDNGKSKISCPIDDIELLPENMPVRQRLGQMWCHPEAVEVKEDTSGGQKV